MEREVRPTRLPVQLPNLNSVAISMGLEAGDWEMLGFTFHIRCKCGSRWDLRKEAKK